jgi:hypothetical protein
MEARMDGATRLRIGVDTGGTFTDAVVSDGSGRFTVGPKRRCRFSLVASMAHDLAPRKVPARTIDRRLGQTIEWWRSWVRRGQYFEEYRGPVVRSALVLKALTCAPTGAIVAAPTTSLPEAIGGPRNWDYRYSWIRDATLTIAALVSVGHSDVALGFKRFIERTTAGRAEDLQITYSAYGERRLPELELPHLEGYRGSRPVRVGNAAASQRQLDAITKTLDFSRPQPSEKTDVLRALRQIAEVTTRRRMVILFSDLLTDREPLFKGLEMLAHQRHDVIVFHVMDDDELTFPFGGMTKFEGLEDLPQLTCDPKALRQGYLEALPAKQRHEIRRKIRRARCIRPDPCGCALLEHRGGAAPGGFEMAPARRGNRAIEPCSIRPAGTGGPAAQTGRNTGLQRVQS